MNADKMTHSPPPAWTQPGWLDQVMDWIQAALAHEGIAAAGPIEQVKETLGSIVLRVPTDAGNFYFKACAPVLAHEAGIIAEAFKLARRLWALSSAVKYKTQMRHLPAQREEYGSAVPGLLQEFLAANPEF